MADDNFDDVQDEGRVTSNMGGNNVDQDDEQMDNQDKNDGQDANAQDDENAQMSLQNGKQEDAGPNSDDDSKSDDGEKVANNPRPQSFFGKRSQPGVERIKNRIKKDVDKDPYHKHHLLRKNVEFAAGKNERIKDKMRQYNKNYEERKKIYQRLKGTDDLKTAVKYDVDYKKKEAEEKVEAIELQAEVAVENVKSVAGGPVGCLKNLKGCLFPAVICMTITGGAILTGLLKVFGVF